MARIGPGLSGDASCADVARARSCTEVQRYGDGDGAGDVASLDLAIDPDEQEGEQYLRRLQEMLAGTLFKQTHHLEFGWRPTILLHPSYSLTSTDCKPPLNSITMTLTPSLLFGLRRLIRIANDAFI